MTPRDLIKKKRSMATLPRQRSSQYLFFRLLFITLLNFLMNPLLQSKGLQSAEGLDEEEPQDQRIKSGEQTGPSGAGGHLPVPVPASKESAAPAHQGQSRRAPVKKEKRGADTQVGLSGFLSSLSFLHSLAFTSPVDESRHLS